MKLKRRLLIPAVLAAAFGAWLWFNPIGRFGWSCYAFTTYSGLPRFVSDLQIRCDGCVRKVAKTHEIALAAVTWLLESQPEVLIVATGWDGVAKPDAGVLALKTIDVRVLKNREALELFNRLKREGLRVAIHYHSTC